MKDVVNYVQVGEPQKPMKSKTTFASTTPSKPRVKEETLKVNKNMNKDTTQRIDKIIKRKKEIEKVLYNPANRGNSGKPIASVAHLQVERAKLQIELSQLNQLKK